YLSAIPNFHRGHRSRKLPRRASATLWRRRERSQAKHRAPIPVHPLILQFVLVTHSSQFSGECRLAACAPQSSVFDCIPVTFPPPRFALRFVIRRRVFPAPLLEFSQSTAAFLPRSRRHR